MQFFCTFWHFFCLKSCINDLWTREKCNSACNEKEFIVYECNNYPWIFVGSCWRFIVPFGFGDLILEVFFVRIYILIDIIPEIINLKMLVVYFYLLKKIREELKEIVFDYYVCLRTFWLWRFVEIRIMVWEDPIQT